MIHVGTGEKEMLIEHGQAGKFAVDSGFVAAEFRLKGFSGYCQAIPKVAHYSLHG